MYIKTASEHLKQAFATNAATGTYANFASRIPTITEPGTASGADGVVSFRDSALVPNNLLLIPNGIGSDNDAFSMRLIGWRDFGGTGPTAKTLWVPFLLAEFSSCTLDANNPGVTNGILGTTSFFCDAITLATGNANVSNEVVSPGSSVIAHAVVDLKGCQKVEFNFDQTTGTPSMNCLFAGY